MQDLEQETPNPWENYRKVERAQYEQQVRTNELERKVEKKNKEIDDRLENFKFFQRGGQIMIRQNMAQTRATGENEVDKTYDMMGFPSDPEDWQFKEFAGTITQEAGIKPHAVWNIARKSFWESSESKYSVTLRFHSRDLGCKKQLHQWFVKKTEAICSQTRTDQHGREAMSLADGLKRSWSSNSESSSMQTSIA